MVSVARVIAACLVALMPEVAAAQCNRGSPNIIEVVTWSAEKSAPGGTSVTTTVRNKTSKPIEMIDATIWFDDVLGGSLGGIPIDRDLRLDPGKEATETNKMIGFDRLVTLAPKNITTRGCTKAVLYQDGTKETFE